MSAVNLYFYVEDLNLTAAQRGTVLDQLKLIGLRDTDRQPKNRNHWRVRLDQKACIFEGWFDDALLSAVGMRNRLAGIFGVSNTSVSYATTNTAFGPAVTFTYSSQVRMRMGVFGGPAASYLQSRDAARAFVKANALAWDGPQV